MGKGKKKPPVYFLRGKKRPVDNKALYECTHCKAGFQGKSEHKEHQNKCRKRSIASGVAAAAAAVTAAAAAAAAAVLHKRGVRGRVKH